MFWYKQVDLVVSSSVNIFNKNASKYINEKGSYRAGGGQVKEITEDEKKELSDQQNYI